MPFRTLVSDLVEMLFRDMLDQTGKEFHSRNFFDDKPELRINGKDAVTMQN